MRSGKKCTAPVSVMLRRAIISATEAYLMRLFVSTVAIATSMAVSAQQPSPAVARYIKVPAAPRIVLQNVRIIDGTGAPPLEGQSLVIVDGKIASIAPTRTGDPQPKDTVVLDLSGRTVMPGIVGMHDHMFYLTRPNLDASGASEPPVVVPEEPFPSPRLYLGAGVTTLRTTGSVEPYLDLNLRAQIDAGHIPGPHMDVTGPYLE